MSIISEALKKVENSSENYPQLLVPPEPSKKRFNWLVVFLLAALAIGIGFKSLTARHAPKQQISAIPIPETKQAALVPAPLSLPHLQLSGIALMEEKNFAIINGDIFKEGDQVEGAQLVKITKDEVTLDRKGREIQLSLK